MLELLRFSNPLKVQCGIVKYLEQINRSGWMWRRVIEKEQREKQRNGKSKESFQDAILIRLSVAACRLFALDPSLSIMAVKKISYQLQNSKTNGSHRERKIYLFNIHDKPIVVCAYLLDLYAVWPIQFKSHTQCSSFADNVVLVMPALFFGCSRHVAFRLTKRVSIFYICMFHKISHSHAHRDREGAIVSLVARNRILSSKYHYVTTN